MPKPLTRIVKTTVFISVVSFILSGQAYGEWFIAKAEKGTIGLSLNYPGVGIRYFMSDRSVLEVRGQADGGVKVGGVRLYDHFWTADRLLVFAGLEADYIDFKGKVSRGSGAAGELFAGFEYFMAPSVSLQADFGPAYIYLKDRHEPVSVKGIEYVANFAITLYWGGSKSAERTWLIY